MDGDNTGIAYSFDNNQDNMYDDPSNIRHIISSETDMNIDNTEEDIQAINKCDSEDDSADEKSGEHTNKSDTDEASLKKKKVKFNYIKTQVIGNKATLNTAKVVKSIYITSCQSNCKWKKLDNTSLADQLRLIAKGTIEIKETSCGLIVLFYNEDDFIRMTKMNLSKLFNTPIAVWNIPNATPKLNNVILIRDVPWCVKIKEIEEVLKSHNIQSLHSSRTEDGIIRIVIKSTYALPRLLKDGFNFYNCINIPVFIEPHTQMDIIQCYRCQRFWHTAQYCPFFERCVRCGEKHDLKNCTRARNNPNCCLCGDSHHAAYKFCPVRIQHLNAVQIELTMERE